MPLIQRAERNAVEGRMREAASTGGLGASAVPGAPSGFPPRMCQGGGGSLAFGTGRYPHVCAIAVGSCAPTRDHVLLSARTSMAAWMVGSMTQAMATMSSAAGFTVPI